MPRDHLRCSKLACEKAMYYYNFKNIIDIRSLRFPGIVSNSKPGGGTTDYIVDMLFSAAKKKDFTCFLKNDTVLPMMHINDAVDASIMLMSIDKKIFQLTHHIISPHSKHLHQNGEIQLTHLVMNLKSTMKLTLDKILLIHGQKKLMIHC